MVPVSCHSENLRCHSRDFKFTIVTKEFYQNISERSRVFEFSNFFFVLKSNRVKLYKRNEEGTRLELSLPAR